LTFGEKSRGLISITRPHLALMTLTLATVVVLLAMLTQDLEPVLWEFVAVVMAVYLAVVGSYTFNDYCDVDIDAIAFPQRAIPSSSLSPKEALAISVILYSTSLVLFCVLELAAVPIVLIAILIITLYSRVLKRRTPYSFLPVGIAYGLVPLGVWFAMTTEITMVPILFCLMICITDWGFTNSDASRDVEADSQRGAPTFPVTFGIPATTGLIFTCWTAGILLSVGIWWAAGLSILYLLGAIVAGTWLLWRCYRFFRDPRPQVGGELFIESSRYRAVLFGVMILDLLLLINGFRLDVPLI